MAEQLIAPSVPHQSILMSATASTATHLPFPRRCPRLFLPVDPIASSAGKKFFLSRRKQFVFEFLHALTSLFPGSHIALAEVAWVQELKELLGAYAVSFVYSAGTPGPNAKTVALVLDESFRPMSICKIGTTPAAAELIMNEWSWLQVVSAIDSLNQSVPVPQLVRTFEGVLVIVQSIGLGNYADWKLRPEPLKFLASLQEFLVEGDCFTDSLMHQAILARREYLLGALTAAWNKRIEKALSQVVRGLHGKQIRMVAAHGDFVPWNMRVTAQGLFVFDWEYASHGYLPLYDLCHYILLPKVLAADVSTSSMGVLRRQLHVASAGLRDVCPDLIDLQLLAYLLNLSLLYLKANDGRDSGDRVLSRYGKLIDSYDVWSNA